MLQQPPFPLCLTNPSLPFSAGGGLGFSGSRGGYPLGGGSHHSSPATSVNAPLHPAFKHVNDGASDCLRAVGQHDLRVVRRGAGRRSRSPASGWSHARRATMRTVRKCASSELRGVDTSFVAAARSARPSRAHRRHRRAARWLSSSGPWGSAPGTAKDRHYRASGVGSTARGRWADLARE